MNHQYLILCFHLTVCKFEENFFKCHKKEKMQMHRISIDRFGANKLGYHKYCFVRGRNNGGIGYIMHCCKSRRRIGCEPEIKPVVKQAKINLEEDVRPVSFEEDADSKTTYYPFRVSSFYAAPLTSRHPDSNPDSLPAGLVQFRVRARTATMRPFHNCPIKSIPSSARATQAIR